MAKLSTEKDRERWKAYLDTQALPLEVDAKPWKDPRKLTANAYLWAYVYGPLVKVAGHEPEEWHEFFCIKHFGGVPYTRLDGTEGQKPKRTTTKNESGERDVLKGQPFNEFLTFVESECAQYGVFIEREYAV